MTQAGGPCKAAALATAIEKQQGTALVGKLKYELKKKTPTQGTKNLLWLE